MQPAAASGYLRDPVSALCVSLKGGQFDLVLYD